MTKFIYQLAIYQSSGNVTSLQIANFRVSRVRFRVRVRVTVSSRLDIIN